MFLQHHSHSFTASTGSVRRSSRRMSAQLIMSWCKKRLWCASSSSTALRLMSKCHDRLPAARAKAQYRYGVIHSFIETLRVAGGGGGVSSSWHWGKGWETLDSLLSNCVSTLKAYMTTIDRRQLFIFNGCWHQTASGASVWSWQKLNFLQMSSIATAANCRLGFLN